MISAVNIIDDTASDSTSRAKLFRTGLLTALAITVHNFPEGMATFVSTLDDPQVIFRHSFDVFELLFDLNRFNKHLFRVG